jgi:hypothetical protein
VIRLSHLKIVAVSAMAAISLSACVTATPYQPLTPSAVQSGGYSETKLETDRWRVTFTGNSLTPRDRVENYLLYRAAELTLAQGKDWFMMADRGLAKTQEKIIMSNPTLMDPMWGSPMLVYRGRWQPIWRIYGGYGWRGAGPYWADPLMDDPFWRGQNSYQTLEKYEAMAEILLGTGPKPVNDPKAFDAKQVVENLGPTLVRPKAEKP